MAANPLPRPPVPWIDIKTGQPTQVFLQFMLNFSQGLLGPLPNFANDAAAAAGGVALNGIYRNGSVVQIRVT